MSLIDWRKDFGRSSELSSAPRCRLPALAQGARRRLAEFLGNAGNKACDPTVTSARYARKVAKLVRGAMSVLLPMTVGFGAGLFAWLLMVGDQDLQSFLLTTILVTIAGTITALSGYAAGWFQAGAGLGAAIALVLWVALGFRSFPSS